MAADELIYHDHDYGSAVEPLNIHIMKAVEPLNMHGDISHHTTRAAPGSYHGPVAIGASFTLAST